MFWPVMFASAIGASLFQLGAQSVWISVMSFGLKAALAAAIVALLVHRIKSSGT